MLGIDCAGDNQPLRLMRYADWAAQGFRYAWVEYLRAGWAVPDAEAHRAAMRAASYQTSGYANLGHGGAADQCAAFLAAAEPGELPDMLDVEQADIDEADVRAWCLHHDLNSARQLVIYTGYGAWTRIVPPAARDWYKKYKLVIAGYPYDAPEGQPMDAASVALRSNPPVGRIPAVPEPWTWADVLSWQFTGHGSLPGYDSFLDLHVAGPAMTRQTFQTQRGSFIGVHSINPGNTLAQALQAKADGADIPGYILLNDPAACAQIADATGKPVFCRFDNVSGDDESLNNVTGWNDNDRFQWATRQWTHILANATDEQIGKIAGFISHNEADPPGVSGWQAMGLAYSYLAGMAATANAGRIANGKPAIHLAYGATAQGTPEWDEAQALVATGLFDKIHAAGDTWLAHEGVVAHQDIDTWYGDQLPGSPSIPFAGALNFRWVYLFSLLLARGTPVKIAITEFYDGGGYPGDPADHVTRFGWVDAHLAALPAEYARWFLFFAGFTCNPDDHWRDISNYDAFYLSPELRAYRLSVKDRQNGVTTMPITQSQIDAIKAARAGAQTKLAEMDGLIAAIVPDGAHAWKAGDVAVAVTNPLITYNSPNGTIHDQRANVSYDLNVVAVSSDGLWLEVAPLPLWVQTSSVKLKGS